MAKTSTI